MVPIEAAFAHVLWLDGDWSQDAIDEHEPVAFAFEGGFADEADEVEAVDGDVDAGFFEDFALCALSGGFAGGDVEFAADGGDEAHVGLFFAVEEEDSSLIVAEIAEAGDAVGKVGVGAVDAVGGHGRG